MMNKFEINRDEDGPDFYVKYDYTREYFRYSDKEWKQKACEFAYNMGYGDAAFKFRSLILAPCETILAFSQKYCLTDIDTSFLTSDEKVINLLESMYKQGYKQFVRNLRELINEDCEENE